MVGAVQTGHAVEYPGEGMVLEGWDGIARAVNRGRSTVWRWAKRARDPLPVLKLGRQVYIQVSALEAWVQRNRQNL